jgi:hypothetical protein
LSEKAILDCVGQNGQLVKSRAFRIEAIVIVFPSFWKNQRMKGFMGRGFEIEKVISSERPNKISSLIGQGFMTELFSLESLNRGLGVKGRLSKIKGVFLSVKNQKEISLLALKKEKMPMKKISRIQRELEASFSGKRNKAKKEVGKIVIDKCAFKGSGDWRGASPS